MARPLDQMRRLFGRINLFCAVIGALLLFSMAFVVCFEVLGRALGAASRLWVIEASEYALLFTTFLGAPYLLEKNRHVVMDLLINGLTGKRKQISQLLNAGIGFGVCVIITVVGLQVVVDQFIHGTREVTVMRPQSWWITAAMPIGTGLMAVQFLDAIICAFSGKEP